MRCLSGAQTPTDNPVLIDITTLDQLYAIRYDVDGDGVPDAATQDTEKAAYRTAFNLGGANNTCVGGCEGYELMEALDFNDADGSGSGTEPSKWAKGCTSGCVTGTQADGSAGSTGWEPIGYFNDQGTADDDADDVDARFSARFHGNELTISNLYVNRRSDGAIYGGLFGQTYNATLDSLNLMDVEVKVESTSGDSYAGGLVGRSYGGSSSSSITSCSATGDVSSYSSSSVSYSVSSSVLSSVSSAGGLVGRSYGDITSCSATGDVSSDSFSSDSSDSSDSNFASYAVSYAGGLVGRSYGDITASYATGDVSSSSLCFYLFSCRRTRWDGVMAI